MEWQFSCSKCGAISALISSGNLNTKDELCSAHNELQSFLKTSPVFIGLSSVGRYILRRFIMFCLLSYDIFFNWFIPFGYKITTIIKLKSIGVWGGLDA